MLEETRECLHQTKLRVLVRGTSTFKNKTKTDLTYLDSKMKVKQEVQEQCWFCNSTTMDLTLLHTASLL